MVWLRVLFDKNNIEFVDHGCWQTRHTCLKQMLEKAYDNVKKKLTNEQPICFWTFSDDHTMKLSKDSKPPNGSNEPFYVCAGTKEEYSVGKLIPDFGSWAWPESKIPSFQQLKEETIELGELAPISDKAFWIGTTKTHHSRSTLLQITSHHPDLFECIGMNWSGDALNPQPNHFVSLPDHTKYKYLIDVQGGGYSGRLKNFLSMNRVLLVSDRKYWDYITCDLEPYEHFIPVKEDLSNIVDQLIWARNNPQKCEQIKENLKTYVDTHCSVDYILRRFEDIFLKLHSESEYRQR